MCSKKDVPCIRGKTIPCVRRRTILVFEEGYSLCSKKDIPCVRGRRNPNFWSYRPQEGCIWSKIWCRSWFWRQEMPSSSKIGRQNREKPKNKSKKVPKQFSTSKNRKLQIVRNAFSRSFAAIGAKFEGRTENLGIYFFRNVYGLTVTRHGAVRAIHHSQARRSVITKKDDPSFPSKTVHRLQKRASYHCIIIL